VVRAVSGFFGFGMDGWYPEKLPEAEGGPDMMVRERGDIGASADGSEVQERRGAGTYPDSHRDRDRGLGIIANLILSTHDIARDSRSLKKNRDLFEELRNNYPVRREFGYYSIDGSGLTDKVKDLLERLGFGVN
jgi:hypothetical protein